MALPAEVVMLESRSLGPHGAPTLGRAYELLRDAWRRGDRDREVALHLLFLAWYLEVEPPHLTGLDAKAVAADELLAMFGEVHDALLPRGANERDAEALYVVGLMAHLFPWACGRDEEWAPRSAAYRARYRELAPSGFPLETFAGRGAYGEYFAGHAALQDAY